MIPNAKELIFNVIQGLQWQQIFKDFNDTFLQEPI